MGVCYITWPVTELIMLLCNNDCYAIDHYVSGHLMVNIAYITTVTAQLLSVGCTGIRTQQKTAWSSKATLNPIRDETSGNYAKHIITSYQSSYAKNCIFPMELSWFEFKFMVSGNMY